MSDTDFVTKALPAVRLAARTSVAGPDTSVAAVVEPLFEQAAEAVGAVGGNLDVAIAQYESTPGGTRIVAGYAYGGSPAAGFEIVELAAVSEAVCGVHLGEMAEVSATWARLMGHLEANSLEPGPTSRQNFVAAQGEDQSGWVVELQQPVLRES